jgi:hypothetical protein
VLADAQARISRDVVPQFELLPGAFSFTLRLCVKYYVAQSVFAQRREGLQKAQNQNRALLARVQVLHFEFFAL